MPDNLHRYIVNPGPRQPLPGLKAAVSTDSAIVTEVMVDVLRQGGKAADAAVAGALVQAAVEPFVTNHAGLLTFLYYEAATGQIHQLDSLGTHPSGLPPFKPLPQSATKATVLASAIIPGFMPGLKALHSRFGTRDWAGLCGPAIEWATRGHPVSSYEFGSNFANEAYFTHFPEGRRYYQPQGVWTPVGETFVPAGLAETLEGVAAHGPDHMITGKWAQAFVATANRMGWPITLDHMGETPPRWLTPARLPYGDVEIVTLAPPQSQSFIIGVTLGVLKHLGVRDMVHGSAEHLWATAHALRQSVRHWEYAQDTNIYGVPSDEVLDDGYHAHLARMIRKSRPLVDLSEHIRLSEGFTTTADTLTAYTGGGSKPFAGDSRNRQPAGSCEFSVVDEDGNWVQLMNTLQGSGIPGMVVGGVPMLGSNATFGNLTSSMDATLVPGAKGRSIIGNTFVVKDGRPILSAGTPGNVHCTVPQVLSNILDFGMDANDAVAAPRMLPMTEDRRITIEDRVAPGTLEDLHRIGTRLSVLPGYDARMGSFAMITRDADGSYTAIADPRRGAVVGGLPR